MRRAARVDLNHHDIVLALRQVGCHVRDTSGVGDGFPDLVVGFRGVNYLLEVKTARGQLRGNPQRTFHLTWKGQVTIVRSVTEALQIVGAV